MKLQRSLELMMTVVLILSLLVPSAMAQGRAERRAGGKAIPLPPLPADEGVPLPKLDAHMLQQASSPGLVLRIAPQLQSGELVQQCLPLQPGWNLFSFNIQPMAGEVPLTKVADVLASIAGSYDFLTAYRGRYYSYYPSLPAASSLTELDPFHGYWIHMTEARELCLTGYAVAADTEMPLDQGWNLVSYLPTEEMDVAEALASIAGRYRSVYAHRDGGWVLYDPARPGPLNSLQRLRSGEGYWIDMLEPGVLQYVIQPLVVDTPTSAPTDTPTPTNTPEPTPTHTYTPTPTDTPTPTFTPTATPTHTNTPTLTPTNTPEPTPTPAGTLASPVLLDGPWGEPPAGAGEGLALDAETGGLTLGSVMTEPLFLLRPDPNKSALANTVLDIQPYGGRLYLGYGDLYNNAGPVDIVSYDPASGSLIPEVEDLPEEQVGGLHVGSDGRLYLPGNDARESTAFGNFYVYDGMVWQKRRTIYKGLHVNGLVESRGRLYASFGSQRPSPVSYRFVLASGDGGASWVYERLDAGSIDYSSVKEVAVVQHGVGERVYALVASDKARLHRFDGHAWSQVGVYYSGGTLEPNRMAAVGDKLLVQGWVWDAAVGAAIDVLVALDGSAQWEVPFLRGRRAYLDLIAEHGDWAYILLEEPLGQTPPSFVLYRTPDLISWERMGSVSLPTGTYPVVMVFAHERLYLGVTGEGGGSGLYAAANATESAEYRSPIFELGEGLERGKLFFEGEMPPSTSIRFQVRSGSNAAELEGMPFVGPDGTGGSYYEAPGQALWAGHEGDGYVQYRAVLSSQDARVAPWLRQVILVTQGDGLAGFSVAPATETWRAGEARAVVVTARAADGRQLPITGEVALAAKDAATGEPLAIEPRQVMLTEGRGAVEVSLQRAVETQICVALAGVSACSPAIAVAPGPAAAIAITTDLIPPRPHWSPVGKAGEAFDLELAVQDRYRNVVRDYTGTVQCRAWSWAPVSGATLPSYTFRVEDGGMHAFPDGALIPMSGEWNLVCADTADPSVAGSVTVNITP